jgi:hypothetical protein
VTTPGDRLLTRALALLQHGTSLLARNQNSGVPAEVDEGINALRIANEFISEHHPNKPICLGKLGGGLVMRFRCLGEISDACEAITVLQQAVRLTPDGHPDKTSL